MLAWHVIKGLLAHSCIVNPAGLLAPLAAGGAAIIPAGGKFSASTHWKDAVEHQATFYTAVPTMHQVSNVFSSYQILLCFVLWRLTGLKLSNALVQR